MNLSCLFFTITFSKVESSEIILGSRGNYGNHQSQAKSFFIPIFLLKQWEKRGKGKFGQFWASLDKFGQVWASLGKFGQVRTRQQIRKMGEKAEMIRKGKKIEW